jgi:hypothetical protein
VGAPARGRAPVTDDVSASGCNRIFALIGGWRGTCSNRIGEHVTMELAAGLADMVDQFTRSSQGSVLVAQIQAGGAGLK